MDQPNLYPPRPGHRNPDEKYCVSCGTLIKANAEACPKCGVRFDKRVDKTALLLFTFFLGGLGAHKFYMRKNLQGALYLIFSWTGIPALIALIEFFIYAFTSSEELREKYPAGGSGVIIACVAGGIGLIYFAAILAAIAIPTFLRFQDRALEATVLADLKNLQRAEEMYFVENNRYSADTSALNFSATPDVAVTIVQADRNCYEATATHVKLKRSFALDCTGLKQ